MSVPAPHGQFRGLYPEQLLEIAYTAAEGLGRQQGLSKPMYLLEPDSRASMLFDAAPLGTIKTVSVPVGQGSNSHLFLQQWRLQNMTLDPTEHQIIAKVQGRMAGALYSRDFEGPLGIPYVFLGQHRVGMKRDPNSMCIAVRSMNRSASSS